MRIIQVAHRTLPHIGGIENYVHRLSRDLALSGHLVEVFTTRSDPRNAPSEPGTTTFPTLFSGRRNPIPLGLSRALRRSRADLIHFHSPWYFSTFAPLLRRIATPTVVTVHGAY